MEMGFAVGDTAEALNHTDQSGRATFLSHRFADECPVRYRGEFICPQRTCRARYSEGESAARVSFGNDGFRGPLDTTDGVVALELRSDCGPVADPSHCVFDGLFDGFLDIVWLASSAVVLLVCQ